MDNFQRNKVIGIVFSNYLRKAMGKQYEVIEPKKKYIPDVDLVLTYQQEELFLQFKQTIKFEETIRNTPEGIKRAMSFQGGLFEETIEKSESQYLKRGHDISNRILILHSGLNNYFIPSDRLLVDRNKFQYSNFKGVYIVSPKEDIYGVLGTETQDEFVYEVKSAF